MMNGSERIAIERQRQIQAEGWTEAHDDQHRLGEMAVAAECYEAAAALMVKEPESCLLSIEGWPWEQDWWKPGTCPERCLEKAGALYLAEAGRLVRAGLGDDRSQIDKLTALAVGCGNKIDELFAKRLARVKVIRLNESEWWMGYSIEEAIVHYLSEIHDVKVEDPVTLGRLAEAGEDFLDAPMEVSEEEMLSYKLWNSGDAEIRDPRNWRCSCGLPGDRSAAFHWTGSGFEHDHRVGDVLTRVAMTSKYLLTFREALAEFLSKGDPCPGMFWAIEP